MSIPGLILLAALSAAPQAEVRNVRISSPKIVLSREKAESDVQVGGQFKVEMSFSKKTAKKPVVRLVCLCEVNGYLLANCIFLGQPGTGRGMARSEIQSAFKTAGVEVPSKEREKMYSDPAKFTPYLSEVVRESYAATIYGTAEVKHGFFRLGRSEKMPKLLLYRIEVWQNGVMVASCDSPRTGLGSYDIPKDWYEWKKYPQKFKYAEIR